MTLADVTRSLAIEAAAQLAGIPAATDAEAVVARLDGPLRIAVAGRVKAGKSTLLNALIRDRVAATDAGECTKLITSYCSGVSYEVRGVLADGTSIEVDADRTEAGLIVRLPADPAGSIRRLEVRWPSSSLDRVTFIDTPGLVSINTENSALTESALIPGSGDQTDADAVLYLMRHVHQRDVSFLEAFMDRTVTLGTPLNAIGLLSRADEIGAGRLDAMETAARIAARYRGEPTMRQLVADVIPTAALLAETAATGADADLELLRRAADEMGDGRRHELVSVDRFRTSDLVSLSTGERDHLLARFGLFGVRVCVERFAVEPTVSTARVVDQLYNLSGVGEVRRRISTHLEPQAAVLKARTALASLRRIGHEVAASSASSSLGERLLAEVERVETGALDFTRLRVLHLVTSGLVTITPAEAEQVRTVATSVESGDRGTTLSGIDQWRARLESPILDAPTAELCQLVLRLFEHLTWASAG
ncbi:MAG: dynamin family protein [Actinomycetota bacterium]